MPEITRTVTLVLNKDYGGFILTDEAQCAIAQRKGLTLRREDGFLYVGETGFESLNYLPRDDEDLITVVQEMGARSHSRGTLRVVTVEVAIYIEDHDGKESCSVCGSER